MKVRFKQGKTLLPLLLPQTSTVSCFSYFCKNLNFAGSFHPSNLHLTHIFKHSGQGFYSLTVSGLCMNRHCMRGRKPIENDEPQRLFC